jgi:hypothetical protein
VARAKVAGEVPLRVVQPDLGALDRIVNCLLVEQRAVLRTRVLEGGALVDLREVPLLVLWIKGGTRGACSGGEEEEREDGCRDGRESQPPDGTLRAGPHRQGDRWGQRLHVHHGM